MGWNTVDKSKSHEARGEDVERRELRLRRTYNEAASGHRLLAQNSAEAPPRAEIDALYWSVLEEVGTARSGKEEAWDGALRVATRRVERSLRPVGPEAHREDLVERGGIAGRGRGRRRRRREVGRDLRRLRRPPFLGGRRRGRAAAARLLRRG